ncbi:uncharacterized protein LOC123668118 [Melitaea cinxia]|uniref:uncharacterized protein LOC123668118 n=1 Tax=Melitaea cinxia TaxID=113334 RepID=UPI001E2707B2|nr:uncharacterized protein LOC123668118 [Melitaea cinxia]
MPDEKEKSSSISRYLRPERFDVEPAMAGSDLKWIHWKYSFENFIAQEAASADDALKYKLLVNHISPSTFNFIQACTTYVDAMTTLSTTYEKRKNITLARHRLATRKQQPGETLAEYSRSLAILARECHFKAVTANEHQNETVCGTFIAGILSQKIRERLLEKSTMSLEETLNLAISLETAENTSRLLTVSSPSTSAVPVNAISETQAPQPKLNLAATRTQNFQYSRPTQSDRRCFFCGGNVHQRIKCPANNAQCQLCSKKGHFATVCRSSRPGQRTVNVITTDNDDVTQPQLTDSHLSIISAAAPSSLRKATIPITLNNYQADALLDTGSSISFIDKNTALTMNLKRKPCRQAITLASLNNISYVEGLCYATIQIGEHIYQHQPLLIVGDLCADVIIGHDILGKHSSFELQFGGDKRPLKVCHVMEASVPPASVFTNLSPNIKPIAIRSRRHSQEDQEFISNEISNLLKDKVIEPSISPWRAQVLVTSDGYHRKRLVIDYSQTINRFTELDAYPLPNIDSIITQVAKYNIFSQIDLKSAYHQVPILQKEKVYTAFEACGNLYQFTRIPFGVTNGVAAFQRTLQYIIDSEKLKGTYAYLDDVTVCGKDKQDHDDNLRKFMKATEKYKLTLNMSKCTFESESINLLGYTIHHNVIKPDKSRLEPLTNLPIPSDTTTLKRALGLFAHYSKWVNNFSAKIRPLIEATFPLSEEAINSFNNLKIDISKSALAGIDDKEIFSVETDASDFAIAATLSQKGRPVAFFSRSLNDSEKRQPSIEKEACAIVEALRKWRHFLIGRHFLLITDQQSVAFMFNQTHSNKIKNEKIERWRLELSCFKYDIVYRPGKQNFAADALSRVCMHINTLSNSSKLVELHRSLCHPGITRMVHWVRSKNLPYSIEEVKRMTAACPICAEIKPRYMKHQGHLIKATAPFERLNLDFKGPIPSNTQNRYILTIIDEYSRFPFAYACKDMTSGTIINCLKDLFSTFGTPAYIHSDRGSSFISDEIRHFLTSLGTSCSRTTPYNPQGNGLVERLNGTLWRTIQLHLRSNNEDVANWEKALLPALHSIRSLLCTGTNATPHERMFNHPRRSINGQSLPTWLHSPGPVYMKKNVRSSKYDPAVEEVQLLQSNPEYSYVRLADGRETTVSNRSLAPLPQAVDDDSSDDEEQLEMEEVPSNEAPPASPEVESTQVRRSVRERRPPAHFQDYVSS